jgi:hypothetical protein
MRRDNKETETKQGTRPSVRRNYSFWHRVGNTMQAIITILQNLVIILTFSYYIPEWTIPFIEWRLKTRFFKRTDKDDRRKILYHK